MSRAVRLLGSTVGAKAAAAVSGAGIAVWVCLHLLGNLTFFSGPAAVDGYAAALRRLGPLLWAARLGLGALVIVHVLATLSLARRARAAAPVAHAGRTRRAATVASRTLRVGGPLLLVFIVLHVLHLTFGAFQTGFVPGHVYANAVRGLRSPLAVAGYGLAAGLVGLHLFHGLWSAPVSVGLGARPGPRRLRRPLVTVVAALVALGFASVPAAVLLGVLR